MSWTDSAAAVSHPRAGPSKVQWLWLVWSIVLRACLGGYVRSLHAQIRPPAYWEPYLRQHPAALGLRLFFPASESLLQLLVAVSGQWTDSLRAPADHLEKLCKRGTK